MEKCESKETMGHTIKKNRIYLVVRILVTGIFYFTGINKAFLDGVTISELSIIYILFFGPLFVDYCFSNTYYTRIGKILNWAGIITCASFLILIFLIVSESIEFAGLSTKENIFVFRWLPMSMIFLAVLEFIFSLSTKSLKMSIAMEILEMILEDKDFEKLTKKERRNRINKEINKVIGRKD